MDEEKWNKFIQTGSVFDYLEYAACTMEGEYVGDGQNHSDRLGAVGTAGGGIRPKADHSDEGTR